MGRVLVALGGNALQRAGGTGDWAEAQQQMRATVPALAALVAAGHELVLTHGNGPQVGRLLRQNEIAARETPTLPMHVLGAETQAQIGYLIAAELTPALRRAKVPRSVIALVSRIEVSRRDPAFRNPTKPIGRFYSETEARILRKREGWTLRYDSGRGGWRRVVPSPKPLRWLEGDVVGRLLDSDTGARWIPVVAGGGGIPVVPRRSGVFEGVDAVIDKDLTAALVAEELKVDTLSIVTDVPAVAVGFGRPWERWLGRVGIKEMEDHLAAGEFGEGSMRPKIEAAARFLHRGGRRVVISDVPSLGRALDDEAGTRILRS